MHTGLVAIAWVDVPEDLAPLGPGDAFALAHLAGNAARLPPEQVLGLRERVKLMPPEGLARPFRSLGPLERPKHSPGGVLVRLFANRNMGRRVAYVIMAVTGRGLLPSTLSMAAYGRKELTSEELADYITVLDISPADLAVVTGIDLPAVPRRRSPGTTETARLIWDVRRLSTHQVRDIRDMTTPLRREAGEVPTTRAPRCHTSVTRGPHGLQGVGWLLLSQTRDHDSPLAQASGPASLRHSAQIAD
jgi:hypothetical protein